MIIMKIMYCNIIFSFVFVMYPGNVHSVGNIRCSPLTRMYLQILLNLFLLLDTFVYDIISCT